MSNGHIFDESKIAWGRLPDIDHVWLSILNVDDTAKIIDVLFKFSANEKIVLHRHVAAFNTFVVQGEHRIYSPDGKLNTAIGIASIADNKTNAKLKVQFFWPFKGDYWIIGLDEDYQYAIVSEPDRQYLWILSRSPTMDTQTLESLKENIREKGFDLNYLINTPN